jgi:hypothetical protein
LPILLQAVNEARTQLRQERSSRSPLYPHTVGAQLALWGALEAYATALAVTGRPLPYRLRDELFLYRHLTRSDQPSRVE